MFGIFRLKQHVGDLEDRMRRLETDHKALEQEWENAYDSMRRLAGKIARRASRDAEETPEVAPGSTIPEGSDLSARIRAARRGRQA